MVGLLEVVVSSSLLVYVEFFFFFTYNGFKAFDLIGRTSVLCTRRKFKRPRHLPCTFFPLIDFTVFVVYLFIS